MANLEEVLAQLHAAIDRCNEIHGQINTVIQSTETLNATLQSGLGDTSAYGEVAQPVSGIQTCLSQAAQATAQSTDVINGMIARFQG